MTKPQTDEPVAQPIKVFCDDVIDKPPSEPASAPVAGESDRPHYPASYDEGVWYCDAHGTFDCRECAARYEDANEWPPPVVGERVTHTGALKPNWPVAPVAEKTEAEPCRARFGVDRLSDDEIEFLLSIAASGHVYTAAEMQRHDAIRERWGDMSRAWYSTAIVFRAAIAERDRKIADLTAERDGVLSTSVCTKCGWIGQPNASESSTFARFDWRCTNCGYHVPEPMSSKITTLESSAKEMRSKIEAQALEIEANAALREEIAELKSRHATESSPLAR